jgi:hypothetical protein
MMKLSRQSLKYLIAIGVLGFLLVSFLSTLEKAYSYFQILTAAVPSVSPTAVVTDPLFWIVVAVFVVLIVRYGKIVSSNLVSFAVWCIKTFDDLIGPPVFGEPIVKGIVPTDSVAWKFEYWTGGEVSPIAPCCPRCGTELEEKILPTDVIHGSDVGFKSNQDWKDTEAEVWNSVHGAPKSESTNEQLSLACTRCRFASPATQSEKVGRESAKKAFKRHIDRMKSGNPRHDPFVEYEQIAADKDRITKGEPSPQGVWDAYVSTRENSELIQFDTSTNQ